MFWKYQHVECYMEKSARCYFRDLVSKWVCMKEFQPESVRILLAAVQITLDPSSTGLQITHSFICTEIYCTPHSLFCYIWTSMDIMRYILPARLIILLVSLWKYIEHSPSSTLTAQLWIAEISVLCLFGANCWALPSLGTRNSAVGMAHAAVCPPWLSAFLEKIDFPVLLW